MNFQFLFSLSPVENSKKLYFIRLFSAQVHPIKIRLKRNITTTEKILNGIEFNFIFGNFEP